MAQPPENPLPPTSDEAAPSLVDLLSKKPGHLATWPGNVPSQAQALEVLRGQVNLVMSLPGARKLQEKLTQPEHEALREDSPVPALREAIAVRWRLAAAHDLLLSAGGHVDSGAFNALLAEVEQAMEALSATSSDVPALELAIDRTSETLSQEAVDFFNLKSTVSAQATAPAAAAPKKADKPAAGKMTFQAQASAQQQGTPTSTKILALVLSVAVLAVGGYHGLTWLRGPPSRTTVPGAPPYTVITRDAASGNLLVRSTYVGPVTPEQQAWLKQQEAQGMRVKQLGPGSYLVSPAAGAPAASGGTAP